VCAGASISELIFTIRVPKENEQKLNAIYNEMLRNSASGLRHSANANTTSHNTGSASYANTTTANSLRDSGKSTSALSGGAFSSLSGMAQAVGGSLRSSFAPGQQPTSMLLIPTHLFAIIHLIPFFLSHFLFFFIILFYSDFKFKFDDYF
jgi:hypothetical protein